MPYDVDTAVSKGFDWAYDHNVLGLQDGLDAAGSWVDKNVGQAKDWVADQADKVGDAVSGTMKALNPFD